MLTCTCTDRICIPTRSRSKSLEYFYTHVHHRFLEQLLHKTKELGRVSLLQGAAYNEKDFWSQNMVAVKTFRGKSATYEDWTQYRWRCEEGRKLASHFNKYIQSNQCNAKVYTSHIVLDRLTSLASLLTLSRVFSFFFCGLYIMIRSVNICKKNHYLRYQHNYVVDGTVYIMTNMLEIIKLVYIY